MGQVTRAVPGGRDKRTRPSLLLLPPGASSFQVRDPDRGRHKLRVFKLENLKFISLKHVRAQLLQDLRATDTVASWSVLTPQLRGPRKDFPGVTEPVPQGKASEPLEARVLSAVFHQPLLELLQDRGWGAHHFSSQTTLRERPSGQG